ncbi:phage major capsid protein [Pseudomonas aeruginosa]|uniref:phage major capsid protein n=1 Tax=Pseudomonas aeruginosa TaxID=287 RepID=UPI000F8390C5|nr:phage major capsid protein [Pseudomonas aeruginosa]MBG3896575.1 phage major capsid protein [Pseudomonas aeruginosa]RTT87781.1 phage major capsid protein [Pseudomonas aeruginosa]HBO2361316.1 phage major capsid protein [Pseudomonas aeruginosa]HBO4307530.1 phage major capsid protein [Pseudomonas aeruginosa]
MKTNRAYSTLEVKALDDEKRVITGIASTPSPDRMQDVVEPKGAQFKLPIPFLWQHNHDEPIGHVTEAKVTQKGIEVSVQLTQVEEPGKLKDRLDEAWQSIKSGLVRGLSIGFSAKEFEQIPGSWGLRFLSWEWFELSAVTIPANAEATITSVKSIDREQRAALGIKSVPVVRVTPAGASAIKTKTIKVPKPQEGNDMKTTAEQIAEFEATRVTKAAEMEAIMTKAAEAGETLDAEQSEQFDTLEAEIAAIDKHIGRLRGMQKAQAATARPVVEEPGAQRAKALEFQEIQVRAKNTEKLEPGIEFARYAMCKMASNRNPLVAFELAKTHYGHNEGIVKALEFEARGGKMANIMKATVEAGTTLDTTWAGPLVQYQNFTGDFVEFLRPRTIIGQFGQGSVPSLNRIPFNVRIAGQTSGGNAYWVGEGAPKPLTAFDFTATELRWAKVATIAVLTNELIRFSNPAAERLVRDGLAGAVIERLDLDFVDPAKAAVANISPASITNGIAGIPSSGNDADAIRADVKALWQPFIDANNPPRNAVYIMDSTTALSLSLMQNPLGQSEFPGLTMNGGTFLGVPAIVSDYLPRDSGGGMVILANASDIWLADDGQVTIDVSQEASLQMLDNPTNNSATGTPTTMVSMFQTDSTAFRAERFINWARRRLSGVSYLTDVSWGA